jgi:hypothetical protein
MKILIGKPSSQEMRHEPIIRSDGNNTTDFQVLLVGDISFAENYVVRHPFKQAIGYNYLKNTVMIILLRILNLFYLNQILSLQILKLLCLI